MKLIYNIIWFENDHMAINWFDIKKIEIFLNDRGFDMNLLFILWSEPRSTVEIPYTYIIHKNYSEQDFWSIPLINADLILMDKDLEGEMDWDKIIEYIRNHDNEIYCDVLFYSTWKSEEDLRKIVQRDGLYFSNRDDVEKKATNIIIVTIKKTQDLNNLRGLVMAETSELDTLMKNIIKIIFEKNQIEPSILEERIKKQREYLEWKLRELDSFWNNFKDFFNSNFFNSSFLLFRTLSSFCNSDLNTLTKDKILNYKSEIIDKRNLLAHHPEESNEWILKIWSENFNEKSFIELRKKIRSYKEIFKNMNDEIT